MLEKRFGIGRIRCWSGDGDEAVGAALFLAESRQNCTFLLEKWEYRSREREEREERRSCLLPAGEPGEPSRPRASTSAGQRSLPAAPSPKFHREFRKSRQRQRCSPRLFLGGGVAAHPELSPGFCWLHLGTPFPFLGFPEGQKQPGNSLSWEFEGHFQIFHTPGLSRGPDTGL